MTPTFCVGVFIFTLSIESKPKHMNLLIRLVINAVIIYFLAWLLPGIHVTSFGSAIIVAIVLGLLNVFLKPILVIFTIPATILTLGLFLFVINAAIIMMAGSFVDNFSVDSFWWALLFSILMSILNTAFNGSDRQAEENY